MMFLHECAKKFREKGRGQKFPVEHTAIFHARGQNLQPNHHDYCAGIGKKNTSE